MAAIIKSLLTEQMRRRRVFNLQPSSDPDFLFILCMSLRSDVLNLIYT